MNYGKRFRRIFSLNTKKRKGQQRVANRCTHFRHPIIEQLESRAMLATTLYLDFGAGIGMGNILPTTVGALRDIDGVGLGGRGTGTDLTIGASPYTVNSPLNLSPLDELKGTGVISAEADAFADMHIMARQVCRGLGSGSAGN